MRRRTLLLIAVIVLLLLSNAAQAQSPVTDQTQAILTGGSYRLIATAAQTTSGLTSAQYRLRPAAPMAGEGCCCKSLLPCIVK